MEELYILGNGFDLYLELETRYDDYFNLRKLDENFFNNLETIYENNYRYGEDTKGKKVLIITDKSKLKIEIKNCVVSIILKIYFIYIYLS